LYVALQLHTHQCTHTGTLAHTHTHARTHTPTQTHTHAHTHTHIHTHAHKHTCTTGTLIVPPHIAEAGQTPPPHVTAAMQLGLAAQGQAGEDMLHTRLFSCADL